MPRRRGGVFLNALAGLGAEIDAVGEDEPLGRGGGLRLRGVAAAGERAGARAQRRRAARRRLSRARSPNTTASGAAATIVVAQVRSPFGVVELEDDGTITGFREAPLLEHWVNSGVYVLGEEALALLPGEGRPRAVDLPAARAESAGCTRTATTGVWLTVNTPKDLRRAAEFMEEHPDWRPQRQLA